MRKNSKKIIIGISAFCIVLVVISMMLIKISSDELTSGDDLSKPIVNDKLSMVYRMEPDATAYQKELFETLNETIKDGNTLKIAEMVVKNFVADFYTWSNKAGNYDVGGLDFIYGPYHQDVSILARDTFYSNLNIFIDDFGRDNLMEVNNVEITSNYTDALVIDGQEMYTFYIEARWTYSEDTKMDVSKLQNKAYYNVVLNPASGRLEIAFSLPIDWE